MTPENNDVRLVGKKSNIPLLATLALIALALVGYMIWDNSRQNSLQGNNDVVMGDGTEDVNQVDDSPKDIAGIYAVTEASKLNNQNINLDNATVVRVITDRLFFVNQGNAQQELLVHLDKSLDEGEEENKVVIAVGQKLKLDGELKTVADQDLKVGDDYNAVELQSVQAQRVYLHVDDVEVK